MHSNLKVMVVSGGTSSEASVSAASGKATELALRKSFINVQHCSLDGDLVRALLDFAPDVVFNVAHGGSGEGGALSGTLEVLGVAYVGSEVEASALAMNKRLAKLAFAAAGLPTATDIVFHAGEDVGKISDEVEVAFPEGVVIKPARQGSALGISFASSSDEIAAGINRALTFDTLILIERRVLNPRELTVAVLENPEPIALPVIEVVTPADAWYDYAHRYTEGASIHLCPAPLSDTQTLQAQELAIAAHKALGCRDWSRTDLLLRADGGWTVLEVNAIPGMTATSLFPDSARAAGYSFEDLVWSLVSRAAGRKFGVVEIGREGPYPGNALSNFAVHPFHFGGASVSCMEALLQALKYRDPEQQASALSRDAQVAKMQGSERNEEWQQAQTLWWSGRAMFRTSPEYQHFLDEAFTAMCTQNPHFQDALMSTSHRVLRHSIGVIDSSKTVLTEREFCLRLTALRGTLIKPR